MLSNELPHWKASAIVWSATELLFQFLYFQQFLDVHKCGADLFLNTKFSSFSQKMNLNCLSESSFDFLVNIKFNWTSLLLLLETCQERWKTSAKSRKILWYPVLHTEHFERRESRACCQLSSVPFFTPWMNCFTKPWVCSGSIKKESFRGLLCHSQADERARRQSGVSEAASTIFQSSTPSGIRISLQNKTRKY